MFGKQKIEHNGDMAKLDSFQSNFIGDNCIFKNKNKFETCSKPLMMIFFKT